MAPYQRNNATRNVSSRRPVQPVQKAPPKKPYGQQKSQQQQQEFPLYPWKMLRPRYGIFIAQCRECRDYDYNNPDSAVENEEGGIDSRIRTCRNCSQGNIYMGNVYKKYWGLPSTDAPKDDDVEEEEK